MTAERRTGTHPARRVSVDGFSLIELLVAIVVLSLGMAGALLTQARSLEVLNGAHWRTQAGMLGEQIIERAKANPDQSYAIDGLDRIASGGTLVRDSDLVLWKSQLQRSLPVVTAKITETPLTTPEADNRFLQRIDVAITWDDRRGGPAEGSALDGSVSTTLKVTGVRYKKP